jgi:hypothetical protein
VARATGVGPGRSRTNECACACACACVVSVGRSELLVGSQLVHHGFAYIYY